MHCGRSADRASCLGADAERRHRRGHADTAAFGLDADRRAPRTPQRAFGSRSVAAAVPAAGLSGSNLVNAGAITHVTDDEVVRRKAWAAAASVVDPEIPVLTIADLGVL